MFLKLLLVTAVVTATMVAVKDGRVLAGAGLLGGCSAIVAPAGESGYWYACRPGRLEGHPDLWRKSCTSHGLVATVEQWRCPAPLDGRVPRA